MSQDYGPSIPLCRLYERELAKAEMPAKLLRSYTGTRFVFGHAQA